MAPFPASVAAYGKPGGGEWVGGDRLVQPTSRRRCARSPTDGADAFYKGWIADRIAEDMKANGGLITKEDLAAYQAKERAPVRGTYRGFEIISMPPPSSGGVALIEMLNILEPLDLKAKGLLTRAGAAPPDRSDAARLSRSRALPRRSRLRPTCRSARLTSKEHAQDASPRSIDPDKASSSVELGKDIVTCRRAGAGRDDALLGRRPRRHGRLEHLHARRRLRLARRRQGRRVPAQQRDGRLQQEAGRDEPHRRHRHAGQPHRAGQARC